MWKFVDATLEELATTSPNALIRERAAHVLQGANVKRMTMHAFFDLMGISTTLLTPAQRTQTIVHPEVCTSWNEAFMGVYGRTCSYVYSAWDGMVYSLSSSVPHLSISNEEYLTALYCLPGCRRRPTIWSW
jgi:hypothetical protein